MAQTPGSVRFQHGLAATISLYRRFGAGSLTRLVEPRSASRGLTPGPSRAFGPGRGGSQTRNHAQSHCDSDGLGGLGLSHVRSTHHSRTLSGAADSEHEPRSES